MAVAMIMMMMVVIMIQTFDRWWWGASTLLGRNPNQLRHPLNKEEIRWQCTKVLKANSQSAAIDKCHVCLGVTSAEKGSLQKWPVYGDIWGRFLPWPISCLANATTNTMQKVAQPLQHYKHHVVMVTNMEYDKVVCKSRKRNISDNSVRWTTFIIIPKPIKNTNFSLQYGVGEIIFGQNSFGV